MTVCRILVKASVQEAEDMFSEYEVDISDSEREGWALIEDYTYSQFASWEVSDWIELAGDCELVYAYYEDNQNAEFVHIKDGLCVRVYQECNGEIDTDDGEDPEVSISDAADIDIYIYNEMN